MSSEIPEEVLELSYEELQTRFEYHLQEWEVQRIVAIRLFTASLLFLSATAAVISAFPDRLILQYGSQPVTSIWDFIGPLLVSFGASSLSFSTFLSLGALREMPHSLVQEFRTSIPDAVVSDIKEVGVETPNSVVYPRQSRHQWYRAVAAEYAGALKEIERKSGPPDPSLIIQLSQSTLLIGIGLVIPGFLMSL